MSFSWPATERSLIEFRHHSLKASTAGGNHVLGVVSGYEIVVNEEFIEADILLTAAKSRRFLLTTSLYEKLKRANCETLRPSAAAQVDNSGQHGWGGNSELDAMLVSIEFAESWMFMWDKVSAKFFECSGSHFISLLYRFNGATQSSFGTGLFTPARIIPVTSIKIAK